MSTHTRTPIMGRSTVNSEQMYQFVRSVNPSIPPELSLLYLEIGAIYSVRGDLAFAQMIKETGYHRFGGDVSLTQYNYAGIGAIGGGRKGASFQNPREGVTAHIQHLYAYASNQPIPAGETLVDPRFHLVTRGVAPHWEDLNGRWAVPGVNYGQEVVAIYQSLVASKPSSSPPGQTPIVPRTVPVWARSTIQKLLDKGVLENPEGDESFYRILVIMDRLNKLD